MLRKCKLRILKDVKDVKDVKELRTTNIDNILKPSHLPNPPKTLLLSFLIQRRFSIRNNPLKDRPINPKFTPTLFLTLQISKVSEELIVSVSLSSSCPLFSGKSTRSFTLPQNAS